MGSDETGTPSKSEKSSSSSALEQNNIPAYPDWPSLQAYYGAGVPVPPPYFNPALTGHPPHPYIWGPPQHMMPPYGSPYTAIYPSGGIYGHPSVSLGSYGHGIPLSPATGETLVATPLSIATPVKFPSSQDLGMKKKVSNDTGGGSQSAGTALEVVPSHGTHPAHVPAVLNRDGVTSEHPVLDDHELKKQRRKQSNRESARRSRLRKQAESEELTLKVESLNVENMALKSEMRRLAEDSEKLRLENTSLMEKLKNKQATEAASNEVEVAQGANTENFLTRVSDSGSLCMHPHQESKTSTNENANSGTANLHQLLEASPRTDAVAVG
ncbi:common plant regulatory factor 1-like isoform X3 [Papaver somniferum]|uniref:common plant regulatory factor 1-like isoform X3 n=1 Tax=Papaver somniferum TaxID=3469 RepID=UPI000E703752|nr:common plant regulatory factor 1-like isoform X3 [Papaver somniferum]